MRINQNISALNTYSRLTSANTAKSKSLEKLSSGLRINRAGDDAAGLAISEKMRGQIGGLKQSIRNAQDGISLIQTAEGALTETHSILNRMRDLAVQSANDTNTDADRAEIQKEINELTKEISRIADTTEFNTMKLLNGSFQGTKLHIGANEGQNTDISIASMTGKDLGIEGVKNITILEEATLANGDEADGIKFEDDEYIVSAASDDDKKLNNELEFVLKNTDGDIIATSEDGKKFETTDGNSTLEFTGDVVEGKITKNDAGKYVGSVDTGVELKDLEATGLNAGTYEIKDGKVLDRSGEQVGTHTGNKITINGKEIDNEAFKEDATFTVGADILDISSQDAADAAIKVIDKAVAMVSEERSKLGATQNRLEHTINNLTATSENLSAAESRVRHVDMAEEMMEFTKNNILSQASTAMLAQANQMPNSVLQLLQ